MTNTKKIPSVIKSHSPGVAMAWETWFLPSRDFSFTWLSERDLREKFFIAISTRNCGAGGGDAEKLLRVVSHEYTLIKRERVFSTREEEKLKQHFRWGAHSDDTTRKKIINVKRKWITLKGTSHNLRRTEMGMKYNCSNARSYPKVMFCEKDEKLPASNLN